MIVINILIIYIIIGILKLSEICVELNLNVNK
jgi:hypothetical protein